MRKEDIERLIRQYLSGELSLDDFRQHFASAYVAVRQDVNSQNAASQLCNRVMGPLAELSRGHRSIESLRQELANAIRPFAGRSIEVAGRRERTIKVEWRESNAEVKHVTTGTQGRVERIEAIEIPRAVPGDPWSSPRLTATAARSF